MFGKIKRKKLFSPLSLFFRPFWPSFSPVPPPLFLGRGPASLPPFPLSLSPADRPGPPVSSLFSNRLPRSPSLSHLGTASRKPRPPAPPRLLSSPPRSDRSGQSRAPEHLPIPISALLATALIREHAENRRRRIFVGRAKPPFPAASAPISCRGERAAPPSSSPTYFPWFLAPLVGFPGTPTGPAMAPPSATMKAAPTGHVFPYDRFSSPSSISLCFWN